MPTMIQKWRCTADDALYCSPYSADACVHSHTYEDGNLDAQVVPVTLWECDGEGCQNTFDDQWSAQACETGHETAGAEGRPSGVVAEVAQ